ncbi:hypothetical protein [Endozoicomonas atrinae]
MLLAASRPSQLHNNRKAIGKAEKVPSDLLAAIKAILVKQPPAPKLYGQ